MKIVVFLTCFLFSFSYVHTQTWYQIPVSTGSNLNSIDFPSDEVGYIAGDSGVILKTTDGGNSWDMLNYSGVVTSGGSVPLHFSDIDFIDELNGFVVVKQNVSNAYQTNDGGLTWTQLNGSSNMCEKRCVYPVSVNEFFIAGAGCFQSALIDEFNTTWNNSTINYQSPDPNEFIHQMDFSGNIGLAAMNSPYMLRSSDSGQTWDTIPTGLPSSGVLTSVMFFDAQTCYAGYDLNGSGAGVLKSTDAGLTWGFDTGSATFYYPSFFALGKANNGDIYCGGRPIPNLSNPNGLMFETSDGVNWSYEELEQSVNDIASYGNDVTFAVGDSGYVIVNTPLNELSVKDVNAKEINVYPNPVNDVLTIQTDFTGHMDIVNIHGEIQTGKSLTFSNLVTIDVRDLASGVYFVRLLNAEIQKHFRFIKD